MVATAPLLCSRQHFWGVGHTPLLCTRQHPCRCGPYRPVVHTLAPLCTFGPLRPFIVPSAFLYVWAIPPLYCARASTFVDVDHYAPLLCTRQHLCGWGPFRPFIVHTSALFGWCGPCRPILCTRQHASYVQQHALYVRTTPPPFCAHASALVRKPFKVKKTKWEL